MGKDIFKIKPTEFFDVAAQQGYYGLESSGLSGKMDYVRKYWEDIITKLIIRSPVEKIFNDRQDIRVVDLGSGSGEGFELLTHIPVSPPFVSGKKSFVLSPDQISYTGIDISTSMIEQGVRNYENRGNVRFIQADLNDGFPLKDEQPYDIYFSSYSSLSHLSPENLRYLTEDIFNHARAGAFILFDMIGKFSLEWPKYWDERRILLPYNMAYLIPPEQRSKELIRWYDVCFWAPSVLVQVIEEAARNTGTIFEIVQCMDRSIFVGRHMDTGLFGAPNLKYRYQVNHLFDNEHREDIEHLIIDIDWAKEFANLQPLVWARLNDYKEKWNSIIYHVHALLHGNDSMVSRMIETTQPEISNELKFLTWLHRNSQRFPVVDFWASVMGPQIAVILRNIEISLGPALGCGHGLLCVVEVTGRR